MDQDRSRFRRKVDDLKAVLSQARPTQRLQSVRSPPVSNGAVTIVVRDGASVFVNDRPGRHPGRAGLPSD